MTGPDGTPMAAIALAYTGSLDEGERVLEPVRRFGSPIADLVQPMPYVARQRLLDEGFADHGVQRYWKSGFVEPLSDALIDVLVDGAATFSSPMSAIALYTIHGATTRVAPDATAYALREFLWDVNVVGQWTDADESDRHIGWVRELWGQVDPHTRGTTYINHMAGDDRPERVRASYGINHDRLAAVKATYDPENFFRLNPNIKPGG
jgi:hypothetical protein